MSSMSVGTDSSTETIYVRLLGEGTKVYRPAKGVIQRPGVALLLLPPDYDAEDEDWEFKPGTVVHFESRALEGLQVKIAISRVE